MTTDVLSTTFAALADPTRRAMLARLATGEATVNELAEPFDITLQAVSRHVKVLEQAGLISRGRDAQFRPCRFEGAALETAVGWIEQYQQVWQGRLDALGQHLQDIQRATPQSRTRRPTGASRAGRSVQPSPPQPERPRTRTPRAPEHEQPTPHEQPLPHARPAPHERPRQQRQPPSPAGPKETAP